MADTAIRLIVVFVAILAGYSATDLTRANKGDTTCRLSC
jgi:hypothetical protein